MTRPAYRSSSCLPSRPEIKDARTILVEVYKVCKLLFYRMFKGNDLLHREETYGSIRDLDHNLTPIRIKTIRELRNTMRYILLFAFKSTTNKTEEFLASSAVNMVMI